MKTFWALTRVSIKANSIFSLLRLKWRTNRREAIFILIGIGSAAVVSLPLYYFLCLFLRSLYQVLSPLGQASAIPMIVIMTVQFLVLVLGFFYTMSVFFFSQDLGWLVALPVTPGQLILAKYATILFNEYLTTLPLLPFLVYFGIIASSGAGYWVMLPLVFLLLPVIPLAIASLLVVVLVRLVNLSRRKDLLIIIGSLFLILLALIPQLLVKEGRPVSQEQMIDLLSRRDGIIQVMGRKFPPAAWAGRALAFGLSDRGMTNFALFIAVSMVVSLVLWGVGRRFYYKGLLGLKEASTRGWQHLRYSLHQFAAASPIKAVFRREWRLMNRTPMFLLNGILSTILFPLLFIIMFSINPRKDEAFIRFLSVQDPGLKLLVAAAVLLICGSLNGTAASAFSREGSCFWISKVIPVRYREQIEGKLCHSLVISLIGVTAGTVFVLMYMRLNPLALILAWVMALLGAVVFAALGMTLDLFHPLLDWISPQRAIKQNLNVFASFVIDIGLIFGLGFLAFRLSVLGVPLPWICIILICALLLVGGAALAVLFGTAKRNYSRIEK